MDLFQGPYLPAASALLYVAFLVAGVIEDARFRKRGREVHGTVKEVFSRYRGTVHFVEYEFEGERRIATYSSGPFSAHHPGDPLRILVDPNEPPNDSIPSHSQRIDTETGNCLRAGAPLISLSKALVLALILLALARFASQHL